MCDRTLPMSTTQSFDNNKPNVSLALGLQCIQPITTSFPLVVSSCKRMVRKERATSLRRLSPVLPSEQNVTVCAYCAL